MPTQITRVPFGLQDLLGSKNFGDNPSALGSVVAPTLALDQFYEIERHEYVISDEQIVTVDGAILLHTIPENQLWLLHGVGVTIRNNGALFNSFAKFSSQIDQLTNSNQPTSQHPLGFLGFYEVPAPGAGTESYALNLPKPIPLFGGSRIVYRNTNSSIVGGDLRVRCMARFVRLNV